MCKSSGKVRRFSVGTQAGFAINLINKKLINDGVGGNGLLASHIEAVKEGEEEAVSFGPTSLLVDYGSGWRLQTVVESPGDPLCVFYFYFSCVKSWDFSKNLFGSRMSRALPVKTRR